MHYYGDEIADGNMKLIEDFWNKQAMSDQTLSYDRMDLLRVREELLLLSDLIVFFMRNIVAILIYNLIHRHFYLRGLMINMALLICSHHNGQLNLLEENISKEIWSCHSSAKFEHGNDSWQETLKIT